MRAARVLLALGALATAAVDASLVSGGFPMARASADEGWAAEFEAVCSKTQDAMALSSDELRALIARCEKLKPAVDALDESRRKVYAKRLQLCRDLYDFVLQTRQKK